MPAPPPDANRCSKTIYQGMINACGTPGGNMYPASVNLDIVPSQLGNGLPAPGGKSYPSYYLASNLTGLTVLVPVAS